MNGMTDEIRTTIIALFKQTAVLAGLADDDLGVLAGFSGFYDYPRGALVFEKGNKSRHFYIIASGEVAITSRLIAPAADQESQAQQVIARFIPGEMFGEFEFFEGDVRTAYAVAVESSRVLAFPRDEVNADHLFDEYAHIFAKIYHTLIAVNAGRQRLTHRLISEKTGWIEELKKQMFFDALTGAYNRTYLEDELSKNFSHLGPVFTLLVIKPDHFKAINDAFGHEAGDLALKAIASHLQGQLRKDDLAIRYRGNEFIVVFPATPLADARRLGESILDAMNRFDIGAAMGRESLFQTFSVGIAAYPEHEKTFLDLVEKAFTSVFEQREKGGNGLLIAQAGTDELNNFLKSVGMLSVLKMSEIHLVSQHLDLLRFKAGDIIFRQNETGDKLFIVKSGSTSVRIRVQDGSEKEIALLRAGEFFGEMAIFDDAPRSATCIAADDCEILSLNKEDFFSLMKHSPYAAISVMKNMLNKTTDRLNASGQVITQMVLWGEDASLRAVTDKLTGVYNRRYLESELSARFTKAQDTNSPLSLVMADMDYFREVNEGYSHEVGDRYIVEVARVFRESFRSTDIVARYGGDEFTILLPDTGLDEARAICEEVRKQVERLDFLKSLDGPDLHPSVSLGIACIPETAATISALTEQADKALYAAKHHGRNRVEAADRRGAPDI